MKGFKTNSIIKDNSLVISLSGVMNEDAKFEPIDLSKASELVLNLSGITLINSIGIRNWLKWSAGFPTDRKIKLTNVPKAMIDQANMLSNFFPKNSVFESFEVPYYCASCEKSHSVFYEIQAANTAEQVKDSGSCPKCGSATELDVLKESYLRFLK